MKCPFCAEEIQVGAVTCPLCAESLDCAQPQIPSGISAPPTASNPIPGSAKGPETEQVIESPKKGFFGKFVKGFTQTAASVGKSAMSGMGAVGKSASIMGQIAILRANVMRAPIAKPPDLPPHTVPQLAKALSSWLNCRGSVETQEMVDGSVFITFIDAQVGNSTYGIAVADVVTPDLNTELAGIVRSSGGKIAATAILALRWPVERWELADDLHVHVWEHAVTLGTWNQAATSLAWWLAEYLKVKFEQKPLIEKHVETNLARPFFGRREEIAAIHRSICGHVHRDSLPGIFSIAGPGGNGKSYLLEHIQHELAPRMAFANVDHQCAEDTEAGLLRLMSTLASRFAAHGCLMKNFDKKKAEIACAGQISRSPGAADGLKEVGGGVVNTAASAVANAGRLTSKTASLALDVAGIGGAVMVASAALGVWEKQRSDQKARLDAITRSEPVQELTLALVEDLKSFAAGQKKYYLPRRPVICFDTYELIGPLTDTWLRTVLLKNQDFRMLETVILIAGRFELFGYNTRWSEYIHDIKVVELGGLDADDGRRYLESLGTTDRQNQDRLLELTAGSPLFLSLVARLQSEEAAIKALAIRTLEEVGSEYHSRFLDMAVPVGFNLDTVFQMFGPGKVAEDLFAALTNSTFIVSEGNRWRFLPAVRNVFLKYGERISPQRVAEVRSKLSGSLTPKVNSRSSLQDLAQVEDGSGASFRPDPPENLTCPECGANNQFDMAYCQCGTALDDKTSRPSPGGV